MIGLVMSQACELWKQTMKIQSYIDATMCRHFGKCPIIGRFFNQLFWPNGIILRVGLAN
jgi:hypothetical protein